MNIIDVRLSEMKIYPGRTGGKLNRQQKKRGVGDKKAGKNTVSGLALIGSALFFLQR
ncbi:hypothetical protein [Klebsiella quasipneumoniae]|uniref:hypothetical protein n=1 Tax=Klebsiella quasipneumoniae TaxID=1463165 RepID=UPI001D12A1FC|nr:hypothetical protein [Klebsiella quasipneumoniae]